MLSTHHASFWNRACPFKVAPAATAQKADGRSCGQWLQTGSCGGSSGEGAVSVGRFLEVGALSQGHLSGAPDPPEMGSSRLSAPAKVHRYPETPCEAGGCGRPRTTDKGVCSCECVDPTAASGLQPDLKQPPRPSFGSKLLPIKVLGEPRAADPRGGRDGAAGCLRFPGGDTQEEDHPRGTSQRESTQQDSHGRQRDSSHVPEDVQRDERVLCAPSPQSQRTPATEHWKRHRGGRDWSSYFILI